MSNNQVQRLTVFDQFIGAATVITWLTVFDQFMGVAAEQLPGTHANCFKSVYGCGNSYYLAHRLTVFDQFIGAATVITWHTG